MKFGEFLHEAESGTWTRDGDHIVVTAGDQAMRRLYDSAVVDGELVTDDSNALAALALPAQVDEKTGP